MRCSQTKLFVLLAFISLVFLIIQLDLHTQRIIFVQFFDNATPPLRIHPPVQVPHQGISRRDKCEGFYSSRELAPMYPRATTWSQHAGDKGSGFLPQGLTEEDKMEEETGFKSHKFNVFVSDRISLHRDLGPDTRHKQCIERRFPRCPPLPSTSVIIVFFNEALSTLLRTVFSVLHTAPRDLLKEILLVDDASERQELQKPLKEALKSYPMVRVLRQPKRAGLVSARMRGAREAIAETLTFLDAHCECWPGWLENLLYSLSLDPYLVVSPVIKIIDQQSFAFERPDPKKNRYSRGEFNWALIFTWGPLPSAEEQENKTSEGVQENKAEPYFTPTIAGGLFAISKAFFWDIGAYDSGMKIWGSENLEMSFRVWMCGGRMQIVPCSVVGHLFRTESPHSFPGGIDIVIKNQVRLAEVWLDDYREAFYRRNPTAVKIRREGNYGDISERLALREKLECLPFLVSRHLSQLLHSFTSLCLDHNEDSEENLQLDNCTFDPERQYFEYSSTMEIRHPVNSNLCLTSGGITLTFLDCDAQDSEDSVSTTQAFEFIQESIFKSMHSGLCMCASNSAVFLALCDDTDTTQFWQFFTST
ncbi:polypeptide N-acetylgalactosaminyltransferase 6-like [Discoglossus pictus]